MDLLSAKHPGAALLFLSFGSDRSVTKSSHGKRKRNVCSTGPDGKLLGVMNDYTTLSDSLEQPLWRVRPQLTLTLCLLTAICIAVWVEGPVKSWMTRQLVQGEVPQVILYADARR